MEHKTVDFVQDGIKKIILICCVSMACISIVASIAIVTLSISYSNTISYIYNYEYSVPDITNTNTLNERE